MCVGVGAGREAGECGEVLSIPRPPRDTHSSKRGCMLALVHSYNLEELFVPVVAAHRTCGVLQPRCNRKL